MSDISSTIRIEDGFTEPLKNLTKEVVKADGYIKAFTKTVAELNETIDDEKISELADLASIKAFDDGFKLIEKQFKSLGETYKKVASTIKWEALAVRSTLENKAEAIIRSTKNQIKLEMYSVKVSVFNMKLLAKERVESIKTELSMLNKKIDTLRKVGEIEKTVTKKITSAAVTSVSMPKKIMEIAATSMKNNLGKAFVFSMDFLKKNKEAILDRAIALKKVISFEIGGMQTSFALSKHYGKKSVEIFKQQLSEKAQVAKSKILDSKAANFIKDKINGYQKYRNIIWDQQDALKANPVTNLADKLGGKGHAFGRWLDKHGMGGLSKKIHTASGNLINKYGAVQPQIADPSVWDYSKRELNKFGKMFGDKLKESTKKGLKWLNESEGGRIVKSFVSDFAKMFGAMLIQNIAFGMLNKLKDSITSVFYSSRDAIMNSIDDITLTDKFTSMYGERGIAAQRRSYLLANDLGEDATMVGEMSARAAYQGIGTNSFERVMRLADRIGKLQMGMTTEGAANELLSNIKSGHDAGTIAQMLGGGQMMERQLRNAGYERALNRGDIGKALEIAEKFAEQAGLTDERYEAASNTMSQDFKKVNNIITNIKKHLSEIYVQMLAPVVKKVKELLESPKFQFVLGIIEKGVKFVGKLVSDFMVKFIDNIHIIGILLGVGLISKFYLMFRSLKGTLFMFSAVKGVVIGIAKFLGLQGVAGALAKLTAKQLLLSTLKMVGPWVAVGAAITGITYAVYKLSGTTKTFGEWLKEKLDLVSRSLAATYRILQNVFTNTIIFFKNIEAYLFELPTIINALFDDIFENIEILIKKANGQKIQPKIYIDKKEYESMSEEAKKALGKVMIERSSVAGVDGKHGVQERYFYYGNENDFVRSNKTLEVLNRIQKDNNIHYISVWTGAEKAFNEGWASTVEWLKKLFHQGEEQSKEQQGIADDTGKIRQFNEQEEELKWLKAFSDRQIMSYYGNKTSNNTNTVNLNNPSPALQAEITRRTLKSIPHRTSRSAV